jgi:hypothetical protein
VECNIVRIEKFLYLVKASIPLVSESNFSRELDEIRTVSFMKMRSYFILPEIFLDFVRRNVQGACDKASYARS